MATYAVGDVQGCYTELRALLDELRFDPRCDRVWLVGDLVNRGRQSLEVLRFVAGLGDTAVTVLGNHDIHLLMVAEGMTPKKRADTFDDVLGAPDRDELLGWLRRQPLIHDEGRYLMVHAGLPPVWTLAQALACAAEAEAALRGANYRGFLRHLYGNEPGRWDESLNGWSRLRYTVNACTRMRLVGGDGELEFSHKGELADAPRGYRPWFESPLRRSLGKTIVFGHWSAIGLVDRPDAVGLDTGCVWGRRLTAVRLEDRRFFSIDCPANAPAGID